MERPRARQAGTRPKELRPTQRMMRFPSIAITRDGMVLRESAPVKVMQFDDGGGEAKLQEGMTN